MDNELSRRLSVLADGEPVNADNLEGEWVSELLLERVV